MGMTSGILVRTGQKILDQLASYKVPNIVLVCLHTPSHPLIPVLQAF